MTFLFDIGRVLLDFDFESSLAKLLPAHANDGPERLARLLERKDEFESGAIEVEPYIAWALQVMKSTATVAEFRDAWQQIFTPNEPMWNRVRQLAAEGHRLILFSNTNGIHCPWIFEAYPEFSLFEGAVLSHQAGFIKPRREIYQHAIDAHGLVPHETLYIDDLAANIEAGRAIGFISHQYDLTDHSAFERWLEEKMLNTETLKS